MSPSQDAKQFSRVSIIVLGLILALAAVIRLARLDSVQTGFQVDEASNAWNAYSLLHTGRDEWGKPWPVFYARAFDDYRSPIYLYFLMPFQALGGMNVYTTRLPAAISGIVTVALIYFIGRRMFNPAVGLLAAAFLALAPSHVEYSQWGYEASLSPLLF